MTRALGLRYLWIDALCIIQDSRSDWEKRASQMARVYRICAVRSALTDARDPTYHFYPPRPIQPSLRVT